MHFSDFLFMCLYKRKHITTSFRPICCVNVHTHCSLMSFVTVRSMLQQSTRGENTINLQCSL